MGGNDELDIVGREIKNEKKRTSLAIKNTNKNNSKKMYSAMQPTINLSGETQGDICLNILKI